MINDIESLKDFMDRNGFDKTYISNDNWVMCCCPFHNDSNPSFGINLSLQGHCFSCGWFSWEEILDQMNLPYTDLEETDFISSKSWEKIKGKLYFNGNNKLVRFKLPNLCKSIIEDDCFKHYGYLTERGFDVRWMEDKFGISVCRNIYSRYNDRIILPVNDHDGKLVFFDARKITGNKDNKYIRPKNSPKTECLGGIDLFYKSGYNYVVFVEGYLSMVKLWQFNIPAVCCFGTELSHEQIKLIMRKHPLMIVNGFDNDHAGIKSIKKANEKLIGCGSRIMRLNMPVGNDPCDFISREQIISMNKFLITH